VVGFTTGSRGKLPGKTCEKRIRNNNNKKIKAVPLHSMVALGGRGGIAPTHT
jgi:hypothetical protein